jgi:flagellar biogenesis protein FliO
MEWMLAKTLMSLCAVLALMVGIVFVLKKFVYKGRVASTMLVNVDVLGYRTLAPKRSVHVVKVLNKIIVVGVTDGGMTSLGEIDDDVILMEIDERMAARVSTSSNFSEYVEKYVRLFPWNGSKSNGKSGKVHFG